MPTWPDGLWLVVGVAVVVIIAAVGVYFSLKNDERRRGRLVRLASILGLRFVGEVRRDLLEPYLHTATFAGSEDRFAVDCLYGRMKDRWNDAEVLAGEFQQEDKTRPRHELVRWSFALARVENVLGARMIITRRSDRPGIYRHKFEVTDGAFARRYAVETTDEAFASGVLTREIVEQIMNAEPQMIEVADVAVIVSSRRGDWRRDEVWEAAAVEACLKLSAKICRKVSE